MSPRALDELVINAIQRQASLHDRDGCPIHPVRLLEVLIRDAFTCTVDELGPRIGRRQLESVRKTPIESGLQSVVRRVPLARLGDQRSVIRIEADPIQQPRVPVRNGRQLVTFGANIGNIQNSALR